MEIISNPQHNLNIIKERIIKTDEVLCLLDVKKKEVNKLDKKYKKLLEKFCAKNSEVSNSNTSFEKNIEDLKNENEVLQKSYSEYIQKAEKKYLSACEEIDTLNKTYNSLKKKLDKLELKENKTKSKKLQDSINSLQKQLASSILKFKELEISSDKTISNLNHEYKQLEEKQNETLKQLAKFQCENNELQNVINSSNKKIFEFENKIASYEVELDILNESHTAEIIKIRKQYDFDTNKLKEPSQENQLKTLKDNYESENKLLKAEILNLNKKLSENISHKENNVEISENNHTELITEKNELVNQLQSLTDQLNTSIEKHNKEKKLLESDVEELNKTKESCESENRLLKEEILNLNKKLSENITHNENNVEISENNHTELITDKNELENQIQLLTDQLNISIEKYNKEKKLLESDIEKLTKNVVDLNKTKESCESENRLLKEEILKLSENITHKDNIEISENNHTELITEKNNLLKQLQTLTDQLNTSIEKHNEEKKLLESDIEKLTKNFDELNKSKESCESENSFLKAEILNLNKKLFENITHNKNNVEISENNHTEFITEKNNLLNQLQTLTDQLNTSIEKHNEEKKLLESDIEKLTKTVSELNKSKESCGTQTDYEDIYSLQDILSEMNDIPVLMSPLNPPSVKLEVKQDIVFVETETCSVAVGLDDIIPNFADACTDTHDLKSFIECSTQTDNFIDYTMKVPCSLQTNAEEITKKDITTEANISELEYKSQNNYILNKPKIVTMKSKVDKTENENKLSIILKKSKINENDSKYVIESSADFNKVKISEIPSPHYTFEKTQQNCYSHSCHNLCHCCQYLNANHHIFCNNQCYKRSKTKYNSSDESDSEDDTKLENLLRDYNNFVIQRYSQKYLIRNEKKRKREMQDVNKNKKYKPTLYSQLNNEIKSNITVNSNPIDVNIPENTSKSLHNSKTFDGVKEIANFNSSDKLNVEKQNQNIEKTVIEEIESKTEKDQTEKLNKTPENNEIHVIETISNKQIDKNPQKYPFALSKKQSQVLRRAKSTKNNITIKKPVTSVKKGVRLKNKNLNKTKIDLFGSDSVSSDTDECDDNVIHDVSNDKQISVVKELLENKNKSSISTNLTLEKQLQSIPETENTVNSSKSNVSEINNCVIPLNSKETKQIFKKPLKSVVDIVNPIRIPETCTKQVPNIQDIDISLAQKLISDVATLKWDHNLMTTVVNYLENRDLSIVLKLIVNQATKDFSQELDKSFTPPAPLLTATQQKILVLISQLEKKNSQNVHSIFLQTLERTLLAETRVEVVHPLTRLYVAKCKLKYDIEKVRMFCCNAAYYMGELILPVMFIVLTTWGDVLPMADSCEDIPLAISLVHVIYLKTCKQPGYNYMNLQRLLTDYYGYKRGEKSNEEIFTILFRHYSETYSKASYTAIVILCKSLPSKWTYNQINNQLIPLIESGNNDNNKLVTISLIQRLIEDFKDEEYIIAVRNKLTKYVIGTNL